MTLDESIVLTLSYEAQFRQPLSVYELWDRLIWPQSKLPSWQYFLDEIARLEQSGLLVKSGRWLTIKGGEGWATLRKERKAVAQTKWLEAMRAVQAIHHIPWVEAVAVTGSLAMDCVVVEDDIDFLVVTTPGRLWLARIWVSLIAARHGRRRAWNADRSKPESIPNSWCFNMWLSADDLVLPKVSHSIYTAYEVIQAQWVLEKSPSLSARFWESNRWFRRWLPNVRLHRSSHYTRDASSSTNVVVSLLTPLFDLAELLAFGLQYGYMKFHMTREKVSLKRAFFHPRATGTLVVKQWESTLKQLGAV